MVTELVATFGGTVYISTNLGVTFLPTPGTGSVFATSSNGSGHPGRQRHQYICLDGSGFNLDDEQRANCVWPVCRLFQCSELGGGQRQCQHIHLCQLRGHMADQRGSARTDYGLASSADGSLPVRRSNCRL